jgi:hypothetical protein
MQGPHNSRGRTGQYRIVHTFIGFGVVLFLLNLSSLVTTCWCPITIFQLAIEVFLSTRIFCFQTICHLLLRVLITQRLSWKFFDLLVLTKYFFITVKVTVPPCSLYHRFERKCCLSYLGDVGSMLIRNVGMYRLHALIFQKTVILSAIGTSSSIIALPLNAIPIIWATKYGWQADGTRTASSISTLIIICPYFHVTKHVVKAVCVRPPARKFQLRKYRLYVD